MLGSTPHLYNVCSVVLHVYILQCMITTYCQLTDEGGQGDLMIRHKSLQIKEKI